MTRIHLTAMLAAATLFVGCDGNGGSNSDGAVTFEGRVTDDAGFGKSAGSIEGAVVTASSLDANGSTRTLEGESTTDASGRFSLDVEGASDVAVLAAEKGSFQSKVLVVSEAEGTVRAMPMTTESEAEAAVFIESATRGNADLVTVADVAGHVNSRLASEWKAGATTAAEIAAAIEAYAEAEAEYYADDEEADVDSDEADEEKRSSFLTLQGALHASANTSAQAAAVAAFEQALVNAYTKAGATLEVQAKARQTSRAALVKFHTQGSAQAKFALRQQAEILVALATAHAVEAAFEAEGASQTRISALAAARTNLIASLRGASNTSQMANAHASYESAVKAELMAELNIDTILLALVETALTTAKVALDASVAGAASAEAVASAYATFFPTAQATAETTLAGSSRADLGARVLTLLTTQ